VLAQGGWYSEYFANSNLAGSRAIIRYEDDLHFEWGSESPGASIPVDNFYARWTRDERFETGTYRFSYRSDDGIRIWVGSTLVVDDWRDRQAGWSTVDSFVPSGLQRVRVEYFEHVGTAAVQVAWERVSGGATWQAEYYSNRKLSGAPVLVRQDPAIDFDWGSGSPDSTIPADGFSVRWQRTLGFTPGTYRFYASCDDGVRITIDGRQVIDDWEDQKLPNTTWGDIDLSDGLHTVVVEYYEHGGEASAHVWWGLQASFSSWQGRYYDNREMRGGPALVRDDSAIDFDWGEGAPASWIPSDNFSIVWTRQINFAPGYYRFNLRSDDGGRVWLDNNLVMDYWRPMEYAWNYLDGTYLTGLHTVKVEYYEQTGLARIHFWWEPSATPAAPAPPSTTPATSTGTALPGPWRAEYFNSADLSGSPALVRNDSAIDFSWGWGGPAAGIDADHFSVRWSGSFAFEEGRYQFTTTTDDGVRLYVDDQLLIDAWRPMRGSRAGYVTLAGGNHSVRVEYFERTQAARAQVTWQRSGAAPAPAAPARCPGGPLWLDAWPIDKHCRSGGWTATLFVQGHGGNCQYTYGWEGQARGGPTSGSMVFEVNRSGYGGSLVGEAFVTSAGETVKVGVFVTHPPCNKH